MNCQTRSVKWLPAYPLPKERQVTNPRLASEPTKMT